MTIGRHRARRSHDHGSFAAHIVAGGTSQPVRFASPPSLPKMWPRFGRAWLSGVTVTCLQVI